MAKKRLLDRVGLAGVFRVHYDTVRLWEKRGLVKPARRGKRNKAFFGARQILELKKKLASRAYE